MTDAQAVPLLWVSYQDAEYVDGVVDFGCAGTQADIRRQGLELREGMAVRLFEDDQGLDGRLDPLVVDGTVRRDPGTGRWEAVIGWVRPVSALADAPGHWCHRVDWTAEVDARRTF